MSLIVETGTASATSESYASVAYADAHFEAIGNPLWSTLLTIEKEQALRRAAMFMCQTFRMQWKGYRVSSVQALDWPRYDVDVPDLGVSNIIMPDTVPDIVLKANVELAILAAAGELNPNKTQGILSKQIGPIKVVYDVASPQGKQYTSINDLLRPLLQSVGGMNFKLRRV